jgi:FtsP/CotA-like multicopper oxidase with cupredoxin domain
MPWIRCIKATNEIDQTCSGDSVPPDTAEYRFVGPLTTAEVEVYHTLRRQWTDDGREGIGVIHDPADDTIKLAEDNRPTLRVEADKTEMLANGVDEVTLTISVLKADGSVNTNFNGTRKDKIPRWFFGDGPRWVSLSFTNGVATKKFKVTESGDYRIRNNARFKVETPLTIEAYED